MDSLKLDRFRKLLNRQNTSINLGDSQQHQQPNSGCERQSLQQSTATTATSATTSTAATSGAASATTSRTAGAGHVINNNISTSPAQASYSAITGSPPEYILRDGPRPAHFIARKLFCDFTELAHRKIDIIISVKHDGFSVPPVSSSSLSTTSKSAAAASSFQQQHTNQLYHYHKQHSRDNSSSANIQGSIFKSLQRDDDIIYDQILRALGTVSEYCLPSLLKYLLLWYNQQIEAYAERPASPPPQPQNLDDCSAPTSIVHKGHHQPGCEQSLSQEHDSLGCKNPYQATEISSSQEQAVTSIGTAANSDSQLPSECGCISPCNNESHSFNNSLGASANTSLVRSPTPSSPDNSGNQISITSTLPLEYQTPAPQTTIIQKDPENANTSTSTANTNTSLNSTSLEDSTNLIKRSELVNLRALLVGYTFCQALIEIFSKLYLHPGHEDLIGQVETTAFEHFKPVDEQDLRGVAPSDVKRLAEKYAEVLGVLAQTRFRSVKKRFMSELVELKAKEPTTQNIQSVCSLLAGMRSFRIKMAPIEEFEASFQFLQELADYFVEVRHKSIKHALAELFVDVLLPLASIVKNEVKIPCLKNFVDTLWSPTLDMCARKKHSATLFPLVTCLLCISQRPVFLQNWGSFLNMCLSNLKNRDQKMCRVALESLYRLVWIYMIRIKGESNNVTQTRLTSIVDSIFPRGSRQINPRDTPLVIFVDMIQFIAQERLDFAMRHIIFDLLSVDRSIKMIIAPERMNIGLQAFLVIADNLQQKEGDPVMPISIGSTSAQQLAQIMHSNSSPSSNSSSHNQQHQCEPPGLAGGTYGARRATAHKMLNEETAKSIGLHPYYNHIQKSFNEILKALDAQFGRPLMLTAFQTTDSRGVSGIHKEPDADLISGDRRLRVDLFKTCVAAIPRLMPDGMSKSDLIDLLSRMTIHIDEEMRRYAFDSLQKLVIEFQDWRLDAIEGFTLFLANQIDESLRNLVDNALKMLLQLLISWHSIITSTNGGGGGHSWTQLSDGNNNNGAVGNGCEVVGSQLLGKSNSIVTIQTGYETISSRNSGTGGQIVARKNRALAEMRLIQSELSNTRFDRLVNVIQKVEGASLVMLCSCHSTTRKLASLLLRECRAILRCYSSWTCMEQFGFRSPNDMNDADNEEGDNLSASMKGSLSADNLSRITTNSINGLIHSSMTSINTQAAMLSTSVSKMCIGGGGTGQGNASINFNAFGSLPASAGDQKAVGSNNQHDLYDEDIENNLVDCYSSQEDSPHLVFWVAVMMLESNKESDYTFALRLLRKILPNLPFEQETFLEELNRNLKQMQWDNFPGIHPLVLKGCTSAQTYDLCISLLDHMTPILRHSICTRPGAGKGEGKSSAEEALPFHVLVLSTYLLATYEDPSSFSMNIARRLALCCEENSTKLENLSAVMNLYSRRSFSKDAFQWIKCVAKYLHDACPGVLPKTMPLLLDMLTSGPSQIQRLILPILYCILTYTTDIRCLEPVPSQQAKVNSQQQQGDRSKTTSPDDELSRDTEEFNSQILVRLYNKCLGSAHLWRDAMQIFRLIISKSSSLSTTGQYGGELPGRTMDFSLEIESVPIIAKARLSDLGILPNAAPPSAASTNACQASSAGHQSALGKCQAQHHERTALLAQQHSTMDDSQA